MNSAKDIDASGILEQSSETSAQQERLREMEQTLSGIAQDIARAVAQIPQCTEALAEREVLSERARNYLARIRRAAEEVEASVVRLRGISRSRPPAPAPGADTAGLPAPTATSRNLRVLLIDDDPTLIESLRSALQDEGHKVSTETSGQGGIDAFRDAHRAGKIFDVVITDLGMPYVDGRQVVAGIRAMSPGTPIILLTGWGQHVLGEQDALPQVDRLLGKPPRIRELRNALAELTGRRATDRLG